MKKYTRYPKSKILDFLRKFKLGVLSKRQFCREENLVPSTFDNWKKKYSHELQSGGMMNDKPAFIPIQLKDKASQKPVHAASPIEISFPNGIQLRCTSDINFDELKKLIR